MPSIDRPSAERRLADAVATRASGRVDLPLRYWNQVAHYVTPASDAHKVRTAIQEGTRPVQRMLDELGLTADDVATRLSLERALVETALSAPDRAPVVVLDAEDGVAQIDEQRASVFDIAGPAFRDGHWGAGPGQGSVRAFRVERLIDPRAHDRLDHLLRSVADPSRPGAYPLDVVVYPKAEMPEEIDVLVALLDDAERALSLPPGRIKVALIAESAAAIARLDDLASHAHPRLCALIAGTVDYAADVGALADPDRFPGVNWLRMNVVNTAAARGVPAIDGMTTVFPVRGRKPTTDDDRRLFLDRVAHVYGAARAAFDFGMSGKWVGHPVQLFAVLLAWRTAMAPHFVESQVEVLRQLEAAADGGEGVIALGGTMIDAASERLARVRLRRAAATGLLDGARALRLGIIGPAEVVPAADQFRITASTAAMGPSEGRKS